MNEQEKPLTSPESEQKPPFGAWWRMYAFVLAFMGLLVLGFFLLSNSYNP